MQSKLKMCAGVGGKPPHSAYIFKNIEGKQYCKQCSLYLNPPKPLNRGITSLKHTTNKKQNIDKQWDFFLNIWNSRSHICENCEKTLGSEPRSYMFDHLLEKSQYPEMAYEKSNIFLCCLECHANKTGGFPGEKHVKAIENIRSNIL